jgi:uncharacterized protein (DUF885 family)
MQEAQARFERLCDGYIAELFRLSPEAATHFGFHDYDHLLSRHDDETDKAQRALVAETKAALGKIDRGRLARASQTDYDHLLSDLQVAEFDREREDFRETRPGMYIPTGSVFAVLVRDFAPAGRRLRSAIERLKQFRRVTEDGKEHLKSPPRVWTEMALEQAKGALQFIESLPKLASEGLRADPSLEKPLGDAMAEAQGAIEGYRAFLRDDLLPRSEGDWRAGKEKFDFHLKRHHFLEHDSDSLAALGSEVFAETLSLMENEAAALRPGSTWHDTLEILKADHPTADALKATYDAEMLRSRRHVVDNDLVTIPAGEHLRVIDTPEFARHVLPFAAYHPPAPLDDDQTGLFYVTPIDPAAPPEAQEERLRGQNDHWITVVALHEGYPGHHLQLVRAAQVGSKLRRLAGSSLFAEGWALYCEGLMYDTGFFKAPGTRLVQLEARLWRAARVMIDASIHSGNMTFDEAVDFLSSKVKLSRPHAIAEVKRYTVSPTQPMTYIVGMREIMRIRSEQERKLGSEFDLKGFHDALLSAGTLSPKLVEAEVFGE